ncbi:hypothetical protein JCM10207_003485 [Rhodosporidiobolus poonsookiae]
MSGTDLTDTVDPTLLALLAPSSSHLHLPSPPHSQLSDADLAHAVLKQLEKHPGKHIKWAKDECVVDQAAATLEVPEQAGTTGNGSAWTPPLDALLLASAHHYTSHASSPSSAASSLAQDPSISALAAAAWLVVRERGNLRSDDFAAAAQGGLSGKSLRECWARFTSLIDARAGRKAQEEREGKAEWGKKEVRGLVERVLGQGGSVELPWAWGEEDERAARWVGLREENGGRTVQELVGRWEEDRVGVYASMLQDNILLHSSPDEKKAAKKPVKKKPKRVHQPTDHPASSSSTIKPTNHAAQPWRPSQDVLLRRRVAERTDWDAIARELGRTKGACKQHWKLMREKEPAASSSPTATTCPSTFNTPASHIHHPRTLSSINGDGDGDRAGEGEETEEDELALGYDSAGGSSSSAGGGKRKRARDERG